MMQFKVLLGNLLARHFEWINTPVGQPNYADKTDQFNDAKLTLIDYFAQHKLHEGQEAITWHPASEPPDNDRTVYFLRLADKQRGAVRFIENNGWQTVPGMQYLNRVDYWAELPRGPKP